MNRPPAYYGGSIGPLGKQPILEVLVAHDLRCTDLARVCEVAPSTVTAWARGWKKPGNRAHVEIVRAYLSERVGVDLRHDQLWTWPERLVA